MLRWLLMVGLFVLPGMALANTRVAVMYFDTNGIKPEWQSVQVGITQMVLNDLAQNQAVDTLERIQLKEVVEELDLGQSGMVEQSSAARIGKLLGVRYFVFGSVSYLEFMDTFQITARLVDVETGRIMSSTRTDGKPADFMKMQQTISGFVAKASSELPESAGTAPRPAPRPVPTRSVSEAPVQPAPVAPAPNAAPDAAPVAPRPAPARSGGVSETETLAMAAPDPKAVEAALAYSEGLMFMDAGEAPKARERFEAALAAKPNLAHAKSALTGLEI